MINVLLGYMKAVLNMFIFIMALTQINATRLRVLNPPGDGIQRDTF